MIKIYPMSVSTPAHRVISVVHKVPVELAQFITKNTRYIIECADKFTCEWIQVQYGIKAHIVNNVIIVEY